MPRTLPQRSFASTALAAACVAAPVLAAAIMSAPLAAVAQDGVDRSGWPNSFSVGTASQGGTYFIYGSGWAKLASDSLRIPGGAEVTGGPVQNAALVHTGQLEFGMVTMGPAKDAWEGNSALAPGLRHDQIRAMFPMYKTAFQLAARSGDGIAAVADIPDGATVGVGPAGGTPGTYWPRFLEDLGKPVTVRHGGASDLAGQLQDGLIDVFAFAAGLPIPAFSQLEAQIDVSIFALTEEEVTLLVNSQPVAPFTVDPGLYTTVDGAQSTVAMWNFAIANRDVPASMVYAVMDAVLGQPEAMLSIHTAAAETVPENWRRNTILPFHEGAWRWLEDNGHEVPADLKG